MKHSSALSPESREEEDLCQRYYYFYIRGKGKMAEHAMVLKAPDRKIVGNTSTHIGGGGQKEKERRES